jgi:phage terminase small subunit
MPQLPVETPNGRLNALQDAFVDAYVSNGGDARAAATTAGYTGQRLDHRTKALLSHPVVTAEITRRTAQALGHLAPKAVQALQRLVGGARSEYVQLQAAMDLLDRLGLRAPERIERQVGELKVVIDLSGDADRGAATLQQAHPPGGAAEG